MERRARDSQSPMRILVVDDSADAVDVTAELLRLEGHEVMATTDSTAVHEAVLSFSPDVVLLDLGMPIRDGFQVAAELRLDTELDELILIALTGHYEVEMQRKARACGFDHYLLKPVDFQALNVLMTSLN